MQGLLNGHGTTGTLQKPNGFLSADCIWLSLYRISLHKTSNAIPCNYFFYFSGLALQRTQLYKAFNTNKSIIPLFCAPRALSLMCIVVSSYNPPAGAPTAVPTPNKAA